MLSDVIQTENKSQQYIDDLIVNLKSISSTHVNEKLCITADGKYLVRDYRYFQCVFRYITGDSRLVLVNFVETISVFQFNVLPGQYWYQIMMNSES